MEEPSPPSHELKPWYYQEWFMLPTVVFWPLWAILILRSPWHDGLISGAVAWAMLIVGVYFIIFYQLVPNQRLNELTIVLIIPGLLLTLITQVHWMRYRPALRAGLLSSDSGGRASTESNSGARSPRRRHRRGARASRSRRGRS